MSRKEREARRADPANRGAGMVIDVAQEHPEVTENSEEAEVAALGIADLLAYADREGFGALAVVARALEIHTKRS